MRKSKLNSFLQLLLRLALLLPGLSQGLQCFQTCLTNCNTQGHPCNGRCGERDIVANAESPPTNVEVRMPAFIVESCTKAEDVCASVEVLAKEFPNKLDDTAKWITLPGGCLLNHVRRTEDTSIIFYSQGAQLLTCTETGCNEPPKKSCTLLAAQLYTVTSPLDLLDLASPCFSFATSGEGQTLFGENIARGGNQDNDMRRRCLLEPYTAETSQDHDCFGLDTGSGSETASTCKTLSDVPGNMSMTCSQCDLISECDRNFNTPSPTLILDITERPTKSPARSDVTPVENPSFPLGAVVGGSIAGGVVIVAVAFVFIPVYKTQQSIKAAELLEPVEIETSPGPVLVAMSIEVESPEGETERHVTDMTLQERKALYGIQISDGEVAAESSESVVQHL